MSLYRSAYCAAFCELVTDALRCCSWLVKRMRTSKGSAMADSRDVKCAALRSGMGIQVVVVDAGCKAGALLLLLPSPSSSGLFGAFTVLLEALFDGEPEMLKDDNWSRGGDMFGSCTLGQVWFLVDRCETAN